MTKIAISSGSLALEPVDGEPPAGTAARFDAERAEAERITEERANREAAAKFLATATSELEAGWVDRPLWESILAQSAGDQAAAKAAYLKTRATILQLEKRDARAPVAAATERSATLDANRPDSGDAVRAPAKGARPAIGARTLGMAAIAMLLIGAGAWLLMRDGGSDSDSELTNPRVAAVTPRPAHANSTNAATRPAQTDPVSAAAAADAIVKANEDLKARIAKVKQVGNWNVVVLLATEWTRREPANVQAWMQLDDGYLELGQFAEALDVATKITQLEPADPRAWRNLGFVQLRIDRRADALAAFEHAASLDLRDVTSLDLVGMLHAQSARLPEAKAAFDGALQARPDDVDALCGEAFVARGQGLSKEADAIERQLQSLQRTCPAWSASVATSAGGSATGYRRVPVSAR